ncbi:MAG: hypothetical protein IBX48_08945 [Thiomicrospira sp.]|uniref:hypothetical protein n=1 Tax=Thiomicrospira sp. TaxID=935 RepID=UPI0019E14FEA|nr:hypothetical protein [Thiomicrospira sp.]MBE0494454.1 hypothetical protein [Thiomicrospira sp.]
MFTLGFIAWVTYQFIYPVGYIKRKAYLQTTIQESSRLQGLSESVILKLSSFIASVFIAGVALFVVAGFGRIENLPYVEWILLFVSTVSFLAIYYWAQKKSTHHLKTEYRFLLFIPVYYLNLLILALVYSLVFIIYADLPVMTAHSWHELVYQARQSSEANVAWLSWMLAYDQAMQHFIVAVLQRGSEVDMAWGYKFIAWLSFTLINAFKLGFVWLVMLGSLSFLNQQLTKNVGQPASSFSWGFSLSLGGIFAIYLLVSSTNVPNVLNILEPKKGFMASLGLKSQTCSEESLQRQVKTYQVHINKELADRREQIITEMNRKIDQLVDDALDNEEVKQGIESFLDWNYSVKGSYMQLAVKGKEFVSDDALNAYIMRQFSDRVGLILEAKLQQNLSELDGFLTKEFNQTNESLGINLASSGFDCLLDRLAEQNLPDFGGSYVGSGIAAIVSARIATQIAAKVSARLAAQVAVKATSKVAVQTTSRMATIAASTASGMAVCSAAGPASVACGIGAGALAWMATDVLIVSADEFFHRDQMRSDILDAIEREKNAIKWDLKLQFGELVDQFINNVGERHEERIRIINSIR